MKKISKLSLKKYPKKIFHVPGSINDVPMEDIELVVAEAIN